MKKLWNKLFFPAGLYERLTDNKLTLVLGIILIGLIDFFLPDVKDVCKTYFTDIGGRTAANIQFNIVAAVFIILLIGAIDVIIFSIPLFDIFKYFKKKEGLPLQTSSIKVMKSYIMAHFLFIPVDVILYYALYRNITENSSDLLILLAQAALLFTTIWSSAIIARGINTLYRFGPIIRKLTFLIVFSWSFLFGTVFRMQIMEWLLKILR